MTLAEYLRKHGIEQKDFAARLRDPVSPALVSQWINGHTKVTAEKARQIEAATSGEVTRVELRPDLFDDVPPANASPSPYPLPLGERE